MYKSHNFTSFDDTWSIDQLAFKSKDEEIRQICHDIGEIAEAQWYWEQAEDKGDKTEACLLATVYWTCLEHFKEKWLSGNDEVIIEELKQHIDRELKAIRDELYESIGYKGEFYERVEN